MEPGGSLNINFVGRTVVVAGGTGGLGKSVSLAFLEEGAKVVVTYRREEEFVALKLAAGSHSSSLEGRRVDVTDEAETAHFISEVLALHGALDVLVNTVGGYAGGIKLWEMTTKTLDQMLALNLRSGFTLARAVMPAMLKARHGSIVNIAAKAALDHGAGAAAYAASKAAAVALMDSLAADALGSGVRVNSILPSIIDTPANRAAMPQSNFAAWPKPEDIAQVVLFLSSDLAKTIHGAAVPVYGNT
jgi:NAD(P)-dependent dehydrogenase (short-subunit alcohol dehydrogenase family)